MAGLISRSGADFNIMKIEPTERYNAFRLRGRQADKIAIAVLELQADIIRNLELPAQKRIASRLSEWQFQLV